MDYCNEIGIHFSTSPYDKEAVDLCVQLGIPFIKIGSGEITWLEQLEYIAKTQIPIMIATGDATLSEIDEAIRTIESTGNRNIILMQCITNYPSMIENANINVLKTYQTAFDILTGYSDHASGPVVCIGATAIGSVAIEKHFTLDKKDKGPDHPHSMEMNEFKQMVDFIRELELAMGTSRKFVVAEETETVIVQRRGLYATRNIKAGEILSLADIEELRPALGILPKYKTKIVGKKANKDIEKGMPIYWESI
jgi:sialic acid synthase SpsE